MKFSPLPYSETLHGHFPQEIKSLFAEGEVWESENHIVIRRLKKMKVPLWHLSIKRKDNGKVGWKEKQEIKNSLCGEDREGFEIYPIENEKVDTSNQYHLWVFQTPCMSIGVPFYNNNQQERKTANGNKKSINS